MENGELGDTRAVLLCDYVVDPVCIQNNHEVSQEGAGMQASSQGLPVVVERWHRHQPNDDDAAAVGRSVKVFNQLKEANFS